VAGFASSPHAMSVIMPHSIKAVLMPLRLASDAFSQRTRQLDCKPWAAVHQATAPDSPISRQYSRPRLRRVTVRCETMRDDAIRCKTTRYDARRRDARRDAMHSDAPGNADDLNPAHSGDASAFLAFVLQLHPAFAQPLDLMCVLVQCLRQR
jgi:hypothetical protein